MMMLLTCTDPLDPRCPEPDFDDEVRAARAHGFDVALLDHDALVEGDLRAALRRVRPPDGTSVLYRGWMMPQARYAALDAALRDRGAALINTPAESRRCHHLPESYPYIKDHTARSVWCPQGPDLLDRAMTALSALHGGAIVKDYVKSLKHHWAEACFIPDINDAVAARRGAGGRRGAAPGAAASMDRHPRGQRRPHRR
jgi:hypothetical protein